MGDDNKEISLKNRGDYRTYVDVLIDWGQKT